MKESSHDVLHQSLDYPPVVEAVAGIEFRSRGIDVVGLVRESASWHDQYPTVSAQSPLPPTRPFGQPGGDFEFQFGEAFPPTRLWSVSPDLTWLAQTQDDRVLLNWRKVRDDVTYPGYEAIRPAFSNLVESIRNNAESPLVPLVAEFSYVNHITGGVLGLHDNYSVFRQPDQPLPGEVVVERYETVTRSQLDIGVAQLTVSIQPANGEPGATMLTVASKVFASGNMPDVEILDLVDAAHKLAKQAFFAIVSDTTKEKWGPTDGA